MLPVNLLLGALQVVGSPGCMVPVQQPLLSLVWFMCSQHTAVQQYELVCHLSHATMGSQSAAHSVASSIAGSPAKGCRMLSSQPLWAQQLSPASLL
jgi:hypothetical protein